METQVGYRMSPVEETVVHYEVRERKGTSLRSVHRACQAHKQHYDMDDQSADPRDVTCEACLTWLDAALKDKRKKKGGKR